MKLLLNLKILVGLGRFLPLCCYVLQNHLVRYITAARCKVSSSPQMPKIADADARTPSATCGWSCPSGTALPCSPTDRAAPTQTNGYGPCPHALSLSQCH